MTLENVYAKRTSKAEAGIRQTLCPVVVMRSVAKTLRARYLATSKPEHQTRHWLRKTALIKSHVVKMLGLRDLHFIRNELMQGFRENILFATYFRKRPLWLWNCFGNCDGFALHAFRHADRLPPFYRRVVPSCIGVGENPSAFLPTLLRHTLGGN